MRKILLPLSILIILSFFILIIFSTIMSGGTQKRPGLNIQSGEVSFPLKDEIHFSLPDLNGNIIDSKNIPNKLIMVDFWASWCPPCIQESPLLSKAYLKWKSQGVEFVGIALWDNKNNVNKFIKKNNLTYPMAIDKNGKVAINFGVKALPEKFFIDQNGKIIKKYIGPIDNDTLDEILTEMLNSP